MTHHDQITYWLVRGFASDAGCKIIAALGFACVVVALARLVLA